MTNLVRSGIYGVDSGAVMAASVFMTIRILWPKWPGPKVVILSGVHCIAKLIILNLITIIFKFNFKFNNNNK